MLKEIELSSLKFNPFDKIGNEWMLITAGNSEACNTMTASWGGLGFLWKKPVSFIFIRPQRYTLEFVEREEFYSLCFFGEEYRPALNLCGSKSGRDLDKISAAGLTPVYDQPAPYFKEASLVLICRKLYAQDLKEALFLDQDVISSCYPKKDYHKVFTGEIVKVLEQ